MKLCVCVFAIFTATTAFGQTTDSLRRQLQLAKHDTTRLKLYCRLGNVYYSNNQNDSLYSLLQQALPLAKPGQPKASLACIYYLECLYYRSQGLSDKSIESGQKALLFFQQTGNTLLVASTLYTIATICVGKGDLKLAINQSIRTLKYAEKYKDIHHIAGAYSLLIDIYRKLHNEPLALFYADQYVKAAGQSKDLTVQLVSYQIKAEIYDQQGKYEQAWPYWQQGLGLARKIVYKADLVATLQGVVANLRKRGRLPEARRYLLEAFQAAKQNSDYSRQSVPLLEEQALIDLQLGQSQAALQAAQKAVRLMRFGKEPVALSHCLATLATIEEASGQYQQALQTYKEYKYLQDTLTSVEKTEAIAQIQASYELDKKENTIQLLSKNAQLQRVKTQQQQEALSAANRQRLLFGLMAFILLILVVIVGYFVQQLGRQKTELERNTEQLQQTITLRDKLFAIISHDLRSPLSNLILSLSLLQRSESRLKELDDLERQVSNVYTTLDNLLYWSLGQQQGLRARLVSLDLTDVLTEVADSFEHMIEQKDLALTFIHNRYENMVLADESMTLICLRNIMHNAIKFTPAGGSINLSLEHHENEVQLKVADTGMGMENADMILTKTTKSRQGTGLGLVVSEELMRQNGGSLSISSQLGKGTTITMTFKAV